MHLNAMKNGYIEGYCNKLVRKQITLVVVIEIIQYSRKLQLVSTKNSDLKGIFVVKVWPWYIIGVPSSPSQQSSSTQRHPVNST